MELEFRDIGLADKSVLSGYLRQREALIVEHSFNTLFAWRQAHHYRWAVWQDWLLLQTTYHGVTSFLPPVGPREGYERPLAALWQYAAAEELPCIFSEVTAPEREMIEAAWPGRFRVFSDRNAANYIYSVEKLTTLSGKKYHAQKNLLNNFRRTYPEHEFRLLEPGLLDGCRAALDFWCGQKNSTEFPTLRQERAAICEMFDNWQALDLTGCCIMLGGRVQAFAIGERLNDRTAAILIEKANSEIKGLYSAINQMFLAACWQDCELVNRAEDLGLANLRRTKMGYLPVRLEMKYILRPCMKMRDGVCLDTDAVGDADTAGCDGRCGI